MQVTDAHSHLFELFFNLGVDRGTGGFTLIGKAKQLTNIVQTKTQYAAAPDKEQTVGNPPA